MGDRISGRRRAPWSPAAGAVAALTVWTLPGAAAQTPLPPAAAAPAAGPAAARPEREVLSIDAAVRRALARHPSLEDAQAAVRRAQAVVAEARAFQRPRLDARSQVTVQGPIPSFTITTPSANPAAPPQQREIAFGKTLTRSVAVSGTYDADPFGRLRASRLSAERGVNVARGSLFAAQNELVYQVQSLYLAALRAEELITVAREAVTAAEAQRDVASAQFRAGVAPEFDVLRASVQVANNRQSLVEAEATRRRALAGLTQLLSGDQQQSLELVRVTLPPDPEPVALETARQALQPAAGKDPLPDSLAAALAEAFGRRPEVYRAEWSRRAAEARVALQKRGNLPSLNLSANFFFNPDQAGFAFETRTWSLVANVAIPIWDGGLTRARVRQAREEVASADAQLRGARDAVAAEVKRSLIDLEEAGARRGSAAANTAQAREALRIARVRYEAGVAPNVEVTDAQSALTLARSNEVNADYDYLAALASLNRSLGRYAGETLAALLAGRPAS